MIGIIEPMPTGGVGAMGVRLLHAALRRHGHVAEIVRRRPGDLLPPPRPAAWFVSCLYPRQWLHVARTLDWAGVARRSIDRRADDPLIAFGGQAMLAPSPIAPFADVIALGDGEVTGVLLAELAARGLPRHAIMERLVGQHGYWVPSLDPAGRLVRVERQRVEVVAMEYRGQTTIEVARGCRSKCAFCPIGWAGGTYREAPAADVVAEIGRRRGRVNLYAPDYSAVVHAVEYDGALASAGCRHAGRDSRIDYAARHLAAGGQYRSYSFGIEGTSERLRRALAKPLSSELILQTLHALRDVQGIKLYIIVGLPGETACDRREFIDLLSDIRRVYPGRMEITPTHFQSIPHTPLQWAANWHDSDAYAWVRDLRAWARDRHTGSMRDGLMVAEAKGRELHEHDAWLQRASALAADYLDTATESRVTSGAWRDAASAVGCQVDLSALDEHAVTPWTHVDVGIEPERVLAAWRRYSREIEAIYARPSWATPDPVPRASASTVIQQLPLL